MCTETRALIIAEQRFRVIDLVDPEPTRRRRRPQEFLNVLTLHIRLLRLNQLNDFQRVGTITNWRGRSSQPCSVTKIVAMRVQKSRMLSQSYFVNNADDVRLAVFQPHYRHQT
eukprot:GHVU01200687.1.p1 GENE.GHVU01200687.1~~GHVU01200687.1.p1  ORF type:complete len:113 (+),score=2.64 GHVU01200687.1:312-650(+)